MDAITMRTTYYDSLQAIMLSSATTENEVINIIQNDFVAYTATFPGFNDNTYRSASSSGLISVLNESDRAALYDLYLTQADYMRAMDEHYVMYFQAINSFVSKYTVKVPFVALNSGRFMTEYGAMLILAI